MVQIGSTRKVNDRREVDAATATENEPADAHHCHSLPTRTLEELESNATRALHSKY